MPQPGKPGSHLDAKYKFFPAEFFDLINVAFGERIDLVFIFGRLRAMNQDRGDETSREKDYASRPEKRPNGHAIESHAVIVSGCATTSEGRHGPWH